MIRINGGWSVFRKYNKICLVRHLPTNLKRTVFNQRVLLAMTCRFQPWSIKKALVKKLEASQRAMERKMLNVNLKAINRQRTRMTDIV